jgi:hypothetical protein
MFLSGIVCSMLFIGCGGDNSDTKKSEQNIKIEQPKQETKEKSFLDSFKTDYTTIELSKIPDYKLSELEEIKKEFIENTNSYTFRNEYKSNYKLKSKKEVRDYAIYILDHKPETLAYRVQEDHYKLLNPKEARLAENKQGEGIKEFNLTDVAYLLYDNDGDAELIKRIIKFGGWQFEILADIIVRESKIVNRYTAKPDLDYADDHSKITRLVKTRKVIAENIFELMKLSKDNEPQDLRPFAKILNSFHRIGDYKYSDADLSKALTLDNAFLLIPYFSDQGLEKEFFRIVKLQGISVVDEKDKSTIKLGSDYIKFFTNGYYFYNYKGQRTVNNDNYTETLDYYFLNERLFYFYTAPTQKATHTKELFTTYYDEQYTKGWCEGYNSLMRQNRQNDIKKIALFAPKFCEYVGITLLTN